MSLNEEIAGLKRQVEEVKRKLRAERDSLLDQLEKIDDHLADLGEKPAKRTYKPRAPRADLPAPAATAPRAEPTAETRPPLDDATAAALQGLRPFWGILTEREQKIVRLRASGKMPVEVGKMLGLDKAVVSSAVFKARTLMTQARDRAEKAEGENAA